MSDATERWAPVPGYEGYYEVSDHGRLRSVDRIVSDSIGRQQHLRGKIIRPVIDSDGRYHVKLHRDASEKHFLAHTLVLEAFVGPRPPNRECCHNDGNPSNNRLSNLRWDTKSENMYDQVRHGTNREAIKTHCPRGHLLQLPNLTSSSVRRGYRNCLACNRAHMDIYYAKRKGRPLPDLAARAEYHHARIMGEQPDVAA